MLRVRNTCQDPVGVTKFEFSPQFSKVQNTKCKGKTFVYTLCFQFKPKFKCWQLLAGYSQSFLKSFLKSLGLYHNKSFQHLETFFISTWCEDYKNMQEIKFSWWLFEGRPRQDKKVLPDWLDWLCYFAGSSKSHINGISISCISPQQVDLKNIFKHWKDFLWYSVTLETYLEMSRLQL